MKLELIYDNSVYTFNPRSDISAFQLASIIMLQSNEFLSEQYSSKEEFIGARNILDHFDFVVQIPTTNVIVAQVKKLREETGEGMMACKKALAYAKYDVEKAKEYLRCAHHQDFMLVTRR